MLATLCEKKVQSMPKFKSKNLRHTFAAFLERAKDFAGYPIPKVELIKILRDDLKSIFDKSTHKRVLKWILKNTWYVYNRGVAYNPKNLKKYEKHSMKNHMPRLFFA